MKKISFVSPTYNEEDNIYEIYSRVIKIWKEYPWYSFEYLIIDNASTDNTLDILRKITQEDSRVKVIVNNRNFGHIRSPYWGILQARGDAIVYLASDLQDPPECTPLFIEKWEGGAKVVLGVKPETEDHNLFHYFRKIYYRFLNGISNVELVNDSTGFGLYDRSVIECIRDVGDPYPYLRGLISELGYPVVKIAFNQPKRSRGVSKNNFYSLFDIAMLGIVSHSLVPIRIASFLGVLIGIFSLIMGFVTLILKLIWWNSFPIGIAPIMIIALSLLGLLFIFIGILGEYIGSVHLYLKKRPIVTEKERINF